jgi:cleavage and polyadenylation specificity factor subunit 1
LRVRTVLFAGVPLLCDVSSGTSRPLIPEKHRREVFSAFHTLAHPGARATQRIIAGRVVWPGMAADINRWCRDCQECARGKVTAQPEAAVAPIPVPKQRFSHIHVDLVGPLPV